MDPLFAGAMGAIMAKILAENPEKPRFRSQVLAENSRRKR
jgi:hypothetical protein